MAEAGERRDRRTFRDDRSVHQRPYVVGDLDPYMWNDVNEARFAGERTTAGEELPRYIRRHITDWERGDTRMARNHRFYTGPFLERNPNAPQLFRKFFEYAQDRWGTDDGETYATYCRRQRNRPEGSAVWNELKTLIRTWDRRVNGNRNHMASINKIDFCSLIW